MVNETSKVNCHLQLKRQVLNHVAGIMDDVKTKQRYKNGEYFMETVRVVFDHNEVPSCTAIVNKKV